MTLLGEHTIAEIEDLIRAKDINTAEMLTARHALPSPPDDTWEADFNAFKARYEKAKAFYRTEAAVAHTGLFFVSDSLITLESAYKAILNSMSDQSGIRKKGDFQDLWDRVQHARGTPIPSNIAAIQPVAVDWDLNAYKASDSLIKKTEKEAKSLVPWIIGGAVGVVTLGAILRKVGL